MSKTPNGLNDCNSLFDGLSQRGELKHVFFPRRFFLVDDRFFSRVYVVIRQAKFKKNAFNGFTFFSMHYFNLLTKAGD